MIKLHVLHHAGAIDQRLEVGVVDGAAREVVLLTPACLLVLKQQVANLIGRRGDVLDKGSGGTDLDGRLAGIGPLGIHRNLANGILTHGILHVILDAKGQVAGTVVGVDHLVTVNLATGEAGGIDAVAGQLHGVVAMHGNGDDIVAEGLVEQLQANGTTRAPSAPGASSLLDQRHELGLALHGDQCAGGCLLGCHVIHPVHLGDGQCLHFLANGSIGRERHEHLCRHHIGEGRDVGMPLIDVIAGSDGIVDVGDGIDAATHHVDGHVDLRVQPGIMCAEVGDSHGGGMLAKILVSWIHLYDFREEAPASSGSIGVLCAEGDIEHSRLHV